MDICRYCALTADKIVCGVLNCSVVMVMGNDIVYGAVLACSWVVWDKL